MPQYQATTLIAASPDAVWSVLDDFGSIQEWSKDVVESRLLGDVKAGVGTERFCDFGKGMNVREQIVVHEPGRKMTVRFLKFMLPHKETTSEFVLAPAGGGTRVGFTLTFRPKGLGRLMALGMRGSMERSAARLVRDLKAHVELRAAASAVPVGKPLAP